MRYRLLGRTGLRVSEVALGTMTFGEDWGWGASREESGRIFTAFADAGGTFVDTSCNYTDGTSERFVGEFVGADRDHFVVATKYGLTERRDDPNAGGNHRKNLVRSLEGSLRRLGTDHVDLLWLHMWDGTVDLAELLRALDDQVRAGKVLHVGMSDTPAWVVAAAVTLAAERGWTPPAAAQGEYNLALRDAERDLLPMCAGLGLTFTPWGVLSGGVLSGRYNDPDGDPPRRNDTVGPRSLDRGARIRDLAARSGISPARLAVAWMLAQRARWPIVPVLGARTVAQLTDTLAALEVTLSAADLAELDKAFPIDLGFPHDFLDSDHVRGLIYGDTYPLIDR